MKAQKQLLFSSWLAFDPPVWAVLDKLAKEYAFSVTVLAPAKVYVGQIYSPPTGYLTPDLVDQSIADVRIIALLDDDNPALGFKPDMLRSALSDLDPDAIWIHCEPIDGLTRQLLKHFYFRRKTRIACFLAENLWQRPQLPQRIKAQILSLRIDALLAVGSTSSQSAYRAFIPKRVRSHTVFMPNFDPRSSDLGDLYIPRKSGDFWVGFVGKLSWEKGWHVLIEALSLLPDQVKAIIAGTGPDASKLQETIRSCHLTERVVVAGVKSRPDLNALYKQVDAVVVPSLTTPKWTEQFGRVIAEAMAAGRPVIGTRSGAIPEVIGDAGILVDEADPIALSGALQRLIQDGALKDRLGRAARLRFEQEFSIDTFARRLHQILNGTYSLV